MWKWVAEYVAAGYATSLLLFVLIGIRHGRDWMPKYGTPRFQEDVVVGLLSIVFWPIVLFATVLYHLHLVISVKYLNPFYYLFGLPFDLIEKLIGNRHD